jgi:integrase
MDFDRTGPFLLTSCLPNPMANITKRFVDAAMPKPGAAETVYFDDKLSGFGIRVKSSGIKSYLIQYRNRRGESRRLTLGQHGKMTAEAARRQAKIKLGTVEEGADPVRDLQEARGAITIKELCEHYLAAAEKGLILGKRKRPKKGSTIDIDRGRIQRHIVPLLGKKAVQEIMPADVTRFMRDITSGKTAADIKTKKRGRAIVKGGAGTAARTVGLLGGIFTYAVSEGIRSDNPVRGVRRPAGNKRSRRLTLDDYAKLGEALAEAEAAKENPAAIAGVKLLALTGARRGEISKLKKTEIDRRNQALALADSKEAESIRPLSQAALKVLDSLPDALKDAGSKYILPGDDGKRPYGGMPKAITRIMKRKPELAGVTAHTLRHSFGSIADDLGYTETTVAAMLGHAKGTVTAGYIHKLDAALIAAADRVGERIETAMAGKAKEAEIVDFPKTA